MKQTGIIAWLGCAVLSLSCSENQSISANSSKEHVTEAALTIEVATIADLKTLDATDRGTTKLYYVMGYYAAADGGHGLLEWRASSTAVPDDILVFVPDDVDADAMPPEPGRFHQVIEEGSFNALRGGLKAVPYAISEACMAITSCTNGDSCCPAGCNNVGDGGSEDSDCRRQGDKLEAIYGAVHRSGSVHELFIPSGTYDIRGTVADPGVVIGPSTEGGHVSIRGAGQEGNRTVLYGGQSSTNHPETATQLQFISGLTAFSEWTQELHAGDTELVGTGLYMPALTIGGLIYLELGADNTDLGQPYLVHMTKIKSYDAGTDTITIETPIPETIPPYTNDVKTTANRNRIARVPYPVRGITISDLTLDLVLLTLDKVSNVSVRDIYVMRGTKTFSYAYVWNVTYEHIYADHIFGQKDTAEAVLGEQGEGWRGWFLSGWKAYGMRVRDVTIDYLEGVHLFTAESQTRDVVLENLHVYTDIGRLDACCYGGIIAGNQAEGNDYPGTADKHNADTVIVRNLHLDTPGGVTLAGTSLRLENLFITGANDEENPPSVTLHVSAIHGDFKWGNQFFDRRVPFSVFLPLDSGTTTYPLPVHGLIANMRTYASWFDKDVVTDVRIMWPDSGGISYRQEFFPGTDTEAEPLVGQWIEHDVPLATSAGYPNFSIGQKSIQVTNSSAPPTGAYMIVEGEFLVSDESLSTRPPTFLTGSGPPDCMPNVTPEFVGQEYFDYSAALFYVATGPGCADWAQR